MIPTATVSSSTTLNLKSLLATPTLYLCPDAFCDPGTVNWDEFQEGMSHRVVKLRWMHILTFNSTLIESYIDVNNNGIVPGTSRSG